jgi:hypothetical protein
MNKKPKTKRGGSRAGAGRIGFLSGGKYTPTYLDEETVETMRSLGGGNLSLGIRRAGKIVRDIGSDAPPIRSIVEEAKKETE